MVIDSASEYFDKLEVMSAEARGKFIRRKLGITIQNANRNAPRARQVFNEAGIIPAQIKTVKDLEKLPITRKTDVIEYQKRYPPYGGFFTTVPEEAERVFISPGPIYEPHQTPKIKWFAKAFWAAGFRKGDIVLNSFTYHMSPAGILFHEGLRACGATVIPIGTGNTDIQIQTMRDLKVTGFVGTPSFLMTVIRRVEELGLSFKKNFSIKRAWFTGEMLSPSLRQAFDREYRIDTYQTYAVTEPGGAIAYECREKSGMHFMDEYIIEIVDPATGKQLGPSEVGEVVVTPIHNKLWGLLRFGTGDLSSYTVEPCPCGRTSYRLMGVLGRTGDAVKVRGMFVVLRQVEQILAQFEPISRFQIVVNRNQERDEVTLKTEVKTEISTETVKKLFDVINQKFQDVCRVKLDKIELLKPGSLPEQHQKLIDQRVWK
jgi:phenylacetate-CoA ligase